MFRIYDSSQHNQTHTIITTLAIYNTFNVEQSSHDSIELINMLRWWHSSKQTQAMSKRCISQVDHWMSASCFELNIEKTELLWTEYHSLKCSRWSLWLGTETVAAGNHVRLLNISSEWVFQRQRFVLLPASPDPTSPKVTRSEVSYWQVASCLDRCSLSVKWWHTEEDLWPTAVHMLFTDEHLLDVPCTVSLV